MNLSQISAFQAVMTSSSMSEAARKMGRTQPAVSLAIRNLEEQLGMKLFERQGRQLIPVPEAHYLLSETEAVLGRLSKVSHTMRGMADGRVGSLRVATMAGTSFLFPDFLSRQIPADADIKVSITTRSSPQIHELVATQAIDFAVADAPDEVDQSGHCLTEIISGDSFCALPKDHPLAGRDRISFKDLDGLALGCLLREHFHHRELQRGFETQGLTFRPQVESRTFFPLLRFVVSGQVLAMVDPLSVVQEQRMQSTRGEVVFRPLENSVRYRYAILSPLRRPMSRIAALLKSGWRDEMWGLIEEVGGDPALEVVPAKSV